MIYKDTDVKRPDKIQIPRKPRYETITHEIDFFDLFKKIEKRFSRCFLFESLGEEGHLSRHSVIGFDPEAVISATQSALHIERDGSVETYPCGNPYELLRDIAPKDVISRGYAGGLTGYIGYDCVNFFEPALNVKGSDDFDVFKFGLYKDGLIHDKMTDEVIYFHYEQNRAQLVREIVAMPYEGNGALHVIPNGNSMDRQKHAEAVAVGKRNIIEGNIFQCEIGFRSDYTLEGDTVNIYENLREVNPSPHMYYVKFDDEKVIGASPELLFRMRQGEMETYPLAGTTKRGETPAEDRALARVLLRDPKEIAEHNMLVDLHRNDLGRVAKFGTVKVRNLMDIKRFSHVQHISSEIVGIISESEDMFTAMASCFPAGTLSGAPKIEAIKIIDSLEPLGRGPYGGGVGTFSFNGDCTFAIPIRTMFCKGNNAYIQTCGGNVYDSNAEAEYEEIQRKLAGTQKVLDMFINNEETKSGV